MMVCMFMCDNLYHNFYSYESVFPQQLFFTYNEISFVTSIEIMMTEDNKHSRCQSVQGLVGKTMKTRSLIHSAVITAAAEPEVPEVAAAAIPATAARAAFRVPSTVPSTATILRTNLLSVTTITARLTGIHYTREKCPTLPLFWNETNL